MGRTIIKFASQRDELENRNTHPPEKPPLMTEEEALDQVAGKAAGIVNEQFLKKYFAVAFPHLSPQETENCVTTHSSLQGESSELNSKKLAFGDWNY